MTRKILFSKLKGAMAERGVTQRDLSRILLVSVGSMSNRFSGRAQWTLEEIYKVMNFLSLPLNEITVYFPDPNK